MKKTIWRSIICFLMLLLAVVTKIQVMAEGETLEVNKNSVVQVVMVYTLEDGEAVVLQSGSGIVINSTTVLTNYHLVHMTADYKKKAIAYIKKKTGKKIESSDTNAIGVSIVKKGDVLISSEISHESEDLDFALLSLNEEIDRSAAILGDSSKAAMAQNVIAIGYPTSNAFTKKGAQLYSASDVNLISGTISDVKKNKLKIGSVISEGNSGGALIDNATGEVIGLTVYKKSDTKKECFHAVPINEIKYYMQGITYTDNSVQAVAEEVPETEETPAVLVDKTQLEKGIETALSLDQSLYTNDSYAVLMTCLQQAQQVENNEQATQEDVDSALKLLQNSLNALEKNKTTNWTVIIIVIVAVILIVGAAVTAIIIVKMKANERERNRFTTIPSNQAPSYHNQTANSYTAAAQNTVNETTQFSAAPKGNMVNPGGTTVLNMAGNAAVNETMVLNAAPVVVNAYLIRKRTGEKKVIDSIEYTVGKDKTKVNFCVEDNGAISRCHMKVVKKGMDYYVLDLNSTNSTYLNDIKILPGEEMKLQNNDIIKVADEEFIFEIK